MAISLSPSGLILGGLKLVNGAVPAGDRAVPLRAGAVHYWRLEPRHWRACLEALPAMGLGLVDVYVPWGEHEVAPGKYDFTSGARDVVGFLRLAHELGLLAIMRPGPHINAELTYFGIPERVVWDPACQARGPDGRPVILPVLPRMFPVPSYASEAYHDEATRFFRGVGEALAPLVWPNGPIVLLQIDNEGALFFRDGVYDQDYHPDAIAQYREFLRGRYPTIDALGEAYGDQVRVEPDAERDGLRFTNVLPPASFLAETVEDMAYYLDWATFQEHLLVRSLERFAEVLRASGFTGIPTTHNFPMAQDTTPLNAARVGEVVDIVGYDFYNHASEGTRQSIARRASELATRCEALGVPAFANEMGAGFPPYFAPMSERDSLFTLLCALAYGLRGFNLYMAVERDRWIGAPVDRRGRRRPFAEVFRKLCAALDEHGFHHLRRRAPVRLLVPRIERRLARVMHAFGPASAAAMAIAGQGPREACLEDDLGLGYPLAIEADTFARSFEQALDARGVPWALAAGEDRSVSIAGAQWIICATSGGFSGALIEALREARGRGVRVTLGPRPLTRDGSLRPLEVDLDVELVHGSDPAAADEAVARALEALELPRYPSDPDGIYATVHENDAGEARVVFVINPSDVDHVARVTIGVDAAWRDALDGDETRSEAGVLELRVRPKTVRMMARS